MSLRCGPGARVAGVLAMLVLAAPASDAAPAAAGCPDKEAVAAEIARLGAARALELTGATTTTITSDQASMEIVLSGHDGKVLGMRSVAAPATCEERAGVAAVVIVAWLGVWSADEGRAATATVAAVPRPPPSWPPPPSPPAARQPAAPQVTAAARPALSAPGPTARGDVAAFACGVHDGDAGTWGAGAQASYSVGERLSLIALGEGTGQRSRPLGPGQAAYRTLRFGLGAALRGTWGRGFLDGGVAPELVRLSLHGQGLATMRAAATWGGALDGRVRLGVRLARVTPFVFADTSYALTAARLTLDDRPDSVTLSRLSFAAGLGVLFSFGPAGE